MFEKEAIIHAFEATKRNYTSRGEIKHGNKKN